MNSDKSRESVFEFPCDFPIKVMGLADDNFDALVVEIVMRHVGGLKEGAIVVRPSRKGKYVLIRAHTSDTATHGHAGVLIETAGGRGQA